MPRFSFIMVYTKVKIKLPKVDDIFRISLKREVCLKLSILKPHKFKLKRGERYISLIIPCKYATEVDYNRVTFATIISIFTIIEICCYNVKS